MHGPPSDPDEPALQVQAATAVLPAGEFERAGQGEHVVGSDEPTFSEYFPASQLLQAAEPTAVLNFPATHSGHGPPSDPDEPTLQMQLATSELAAGEAELVGHAEQTESDVPPTATEYMSFPQSWHGDLSPCPSPTLYFPATHGSHSHCSFPDQPAGQVHAFWDELPAGEIEFGGHGLHGAPSDEK